MADSDNTTTLPFVIAQPGDEPRGLAAQTRDPALRLWRDWHRARHVSLVLCRVQQRMETRMAVTTGIPGLTAGKQNRRETAVTATDAGSEYAVAREAEVVAMTAALKFQDAIPNVPALSLPGIVAKLEMIVGADRDIGDPTDFPWPHIVSVLRDLKKIAGNLPAHRTSRSGTRADVARFWKEAAKLVAALEAEDGP